MDTTKTNGNDHYLCTLGFSMLSREVSRAWTGNSNVFLVTSKLELHDQNIRWELTEVRQRLEYDAVQFVQLKGIVYLETGHFVPLELHSRKSFFYFLLDKTRISNFYVIDQGKQFLERDDTIREILLDWRDKDIEMSTDGTALRFTFFFNSYFNQRYYNVVYQVVREICRVFRQKHP